MPLLATGRWADVVNLDQVRIAAGRPPRDEPASVADSYRHAPGIWAVAEPSQTSAPGILEQFGQDLPDGRVQRVLRILPQRQVRLAPRARGRAAWSQLVGGQLNELSRVGQAGLDPGGILGPVPPHGRLQLRHHRRRVEVDNPSSSTSTR
jgi:hypothetical protein